MYLGFCRAGFRWIRQNFWWQAARSHSSMFTSVTYAKVLKTTPKDFIKAKLKRENFLKSEFWGAGDLWKYFASHLSRISHISLEDVSFLSSYLSIRSRCLSFLFFYVVTFWMSVVIHGSCQAMHDSPASLVAIHEYAVELLRQRTFGFMPSFRGRYQFDKLWREKDLQQPGSDFSYFQDV